VKDIAMTDTDENSPKIHYICQTYILKPGKQGGLQVDKLLQYTSAAQAEERAEREARSETCVGADAYMLTEDPGSGEVGPPTFLGRHGTVPEDDF
jgi:hypothetical protein